MSAKEAREAIDFNKGPLINKEMDSLLKKFEERIKEKGYQEYYFRFATSEDDWDYETKSLTFKKLAEVLDNLGYKTEYNKSEYHTGKKYTDLWVRW